jgi:hypothetical protein
MAKAKNTSEMAQDDLGTEPDDYVVLSPVRIGTETIVPGTAEEPAIIALDEDMAKALLDIGAIAPIKVAPEADGKTQE